MLNAGPVLDLKIAKDVLKWRLEGEYGNQYWADENGRPIWLSFTPPQFSTSVTYAFKYLVARFKGSSNRGFSLSYQIATPHLQWTACFGNVCSQNESPALAICNSAIELAPTLPLRVHNPIPKLKLLEFHESDKIIAAFDAISFRLG